MNKEKLKNICKKIDKDKEYYIKSFLIVFAGIDNKEDLEEIYKIFLNSNEELFSEKINKYKEIIEKREIIKKEEIIMSINECVNQNLKKIDIEKHLKKIESIKIIENNKDCIKFKFIVKDSEFKINNKLQRESKEQEKYLIGFIKDESKFITAYEKLNKTKIIEYANEDKSIDYVIEIYDGKNLNCKIYQKNLSEIDKLKMKLGKIEEIWNGKSKNIKEEIKEIKEIGLNLIKENISYVKDIKLNKNFNINEYIREKENELNKKYSNDFYVKDFVIKYLSLIFKKIEIAKVFDKKYDDLNLILMNKYSKIILEEIKIIKRELYGLNDRKISYEDLKRRAEEELKQENKQ